MDNAADTTVEIGTTDGRLCVRIRGPAVYSAAPVLDRLMSDYVAAHPTNPAIAVDLTHSPWIDSTLAGWLLQLRRRIAASSGTLALSGCSQPCREAFDRMHVSSLFESVSVREPREWRKIASASEPVAARPDAKTGNTANQSATLQLMADAHAALAALDEENRRVFGPIAEMLRRQLTLPTTPGEAAT